MHHRSSDCTVPMDVNDRFRVVREAKACFRCATPGHLCRWKKCQCGRLHIPQLCTGPRPSAAFNAAPFHTYESTASQSETSSVHQVQGHGLRMRTVSIRLGNRIAKALCDTGSTYSLMSTRLAQSIPHQVIGKKKLRIQTFGSIIEEEFTVIRVIADIPGDNADPLNIIIGEGYYNRIIVGRPVAISGGLKAKLTIFGWMLHGSGSQFSVHSNSAYVFKASVQEQLAEFWNLEHLGVYTTELHDRDLEREIRSNLTRDEAGRYITGWPWKPQSRCHLASNKAVSERRLQKLLDRLSADDYKAYDSEVQNLLDAGYIEKIPVDETSQSYLPHRGVVKASSATTKLRIVYDASTKSEGKLSLMRHWKRT